MKSLKLYFIFVAFILVASCNFMDHAKCEDTVINSVKSPDGKYTVIVYHRSCSAGTGKYTWIKLTKESSSFWSSEYEETLISINGYHSVEITWVSSTQLEMKSPAFENKVLKNHKLGEIEITYK